jgi:hypothetical protein
MSASSRRSAASSRRSATVLVLLAASGFAGCGSSSSGPIVDAGPDVTNAPDCPASLPIAATACPVTLGTASCTYGCASGDPGNAICRSGKWVVGRTDVVCSPGPSKDAGSVACGAASSCNGVELCVQPCCGGAAPACVAKPDGGACPAGTHETTTCSFGSPPGPGPYCQDNPCTPAPPYCSPSAPAGCTPSAPGSRLLSCQCA